MSVMPPVAVAMTKALLAASPSLMGAEGRPVMALPFMLMGPCAAPEKVKGPEKVAVPVAVMPTVETLPEKKASLKRTEVVPRLMSLVTTGTTSPS
jgi:hypothetical protein